MARSNKRYGWIPDLPDNRDYILSLPELGPLPPSVDLRTKCPPVYDQEQLGSCTGNACEALFRFENNKQSAADYEGSRLFCYFNGRAEEGSTDSDSGAMIRDVIKAIHADGVASESCWPYDITRFDQRAPQSCYDGALLHQSLQYHRIRQSVSLMKGCLAKGSPFVFGFTVYSSFESEIVAHNGIVRMPQIGDQVLGGHAVMAVGYNDADHRFIVRNSWGKDWGQSGYFTMPYDYLTSPDLSDDFWTISLVEV